MKKRRNSINHLKRGEIRGGRREDEVSRFRRNSENKEKVEEEEEGRE